jgi:hypothetical protein
VSADVGTWTLVIWVVLHPLSFQKVPPELVVLRATVSVLDGSAGEPLVFHVSTVICEEQAPAAVLTAEDENVNWLKGLSATKMAAQP